MTGVPQKAIERSHTEAQEWPNQITQSAWRRYDVSVLISEGILAVGDGYRAKNAELSTIGIPFARAGNIGNGFQFFGADCFPPDELHRVGEKVSQPGDTVFTSKGTVGRFAFVKEDTPPFVYSPQLSYWRSKNSQFLEPRFLHYWMAGEEFTSQFKSVASQTDMAEYVSLGDQRRMHITLPPLPEQRRIAHVLGTLDDKIELNRRMNETLEEMARALFKSWFVDFDPVRAKMAGEDTGLPPEIVALFPERLADSELGLIPEGWEVGAIEDLCASIQSGGTPARKTSVFWTNGSIPWYKTGELQDGPLLDSLEHITQTAIKKSACKLWPAGTIMFALYASPTVGRLGVLIRPGTSNQAAAGLIPKPAYGVPFLRRLLLVERISLQSIAVGAAQQNINLGVLKAHRIVVPDVRVTESFSRLIAPYDDQQSALLEESNTLTAMRESLLPKLVSGEVQV